MRNAAVAVVSTLGMASMALAAPINLAVTNPGFETDAATRIGQQNGAPPGWTSTGVFGTMNPGTLGYYDETNANYVSNNHGTLVAFAQGGASLSQTLTDVYTPNTTYVFSILAGDSYENASGNYSIALLNGVTTLASYSNAFPTAYTTETGSVTYTTGAAGAELGNPITLLISADTGATKTFDNVVVTADAGGTAVPEPASLSLLALGGAAMLRRRRA
jgi:hypothetical protein